jgi:hypothetical protein
MGRAAEIPQFCPSLLQWHTAFPILQQAGRPARAGCHLLVSVKTRAVLLPMDLGSLHVNANSGLSPVIIRRKCLRKQRKFVLFTSLTGVLPTFNERTGGEASGEEDWQDCGQAQDLAMIPHMPQTSKQQQNKPNEFFQTKLDSRGRPRP